MSRRPETLLYGTIAVVSFVVTVAAIVIIFVVLAARNRTGQQSQSTAVAVGIASATAGVPGATNTAPPSTSNLASGDNDVLAATHQNQTLHAIIDPRLTLMAAGTTFAPVVTDTPASTLTPTLQEIPATISTPSIVPTVVSLLNTTTPTDAPESSNTTPDSTAGQIDGTHQIETIRAIIAPRLTLTASKVAAQTATSLALDTATYAMYQSQTALVETITATATATDPGYTYTPPNGTDLFRTAVAGANQLLTQTYSLQITQAFQSTVNSIINQTLGISPTATVADTSTPTATPTITSTAPTSTLNATETYATMIAAFNHSLTETPEAQIAQSVTAVFQSTIQSLVNQQFTATAAGVKAGLANGYDALTTGNATKLSIILTIKNRDSGANSIAFNSDGTQFASANSDNTVRVWDTVSGVELYSFPGLTDRLSVSFSPDNAFLAAASSDNTIRLWDLKKRQEISPLRGHTKGVINAVFSPANSLLASISSDGTTRLWPLQGAGTANELKQSALALAFSPDGLRLITGGQDAKITIWESLTGIQLSTIRESQSLTALSFSPDGRFFASGGSASIVNVWDAGSGQKVQVMKGPTKPITSVAFCPDASCVAASSKDGSIWLWDTQSGAILLTLTGSVNGVNSIAISSDGRRLVIAGADSTITVWGIPGAVSAINTAQR